MCLKNPKSLPNFEQHDRIGSRIFKIRSDVHEFIRRRGSARKAGKSLELFVLWQNLYILDEPTSGLNDVDIDKFIQVLFSLQKNGETAIIIEHNVEFIKTVADHIIDFGISGGESGGKSSRKDFRKQYLPTKSLRYTVWIN